MKLPLVILCQVCSKQLEAQPHHLKEFLDHPETILVCDTCGLKHTDTLDTIEHLTCVSKYIN